MRDPQRIVDEIRAFLMASDQSQNERIPELAKEYQEACEEINVRLARCSQLIRQGLRPEAIHLAEAEPNLLTSLQTLDFLDRGAWIDLASIYQLDAPPDLDHVVAEHLSSAYTELDPLRSLLRKHRRLALARAPLPDRLVLVRELARVDPTNSIWDEDRRAYELARFKQIQGEAVEASRRGDSAKIEALDRELADDPWSARPPGSLVQGLRKAADSMRQASARRGLQPVEAELNDAFSALDPDRARQARARWLDLTETAQLPNDDPLRDRVESSLIWLDNLDSRDSRRKAHAAALGWLSQALDDPSTPREELERHHASLVRIEQEMGETSGSDPLTHRFRARVAGLELSASRRMRLVIAAGALVAVVIGASAFLVYRVAEVASAGRVAAESLDKALATQEIEDVEDLLAHYAKTRPELVDHAAVVSRMPAVEKARAAEASRLRDFNELKAGADAADLTGKEPPALGEARTLARTVAEKQAVERLARSIDRKGRDVAAAIDGKLLPELGAMSKVLDGVEADARNIERFGPELAVRLTEASRRLNAVVPQEGPISETTRTLVDRLRERIIADGNEINLIGSRIQSAKLLTESIRGLPDNAEGYAAAANALGQAFQGAVQESEVKTVLSETERSAWASALAWSSKVRAWAGETKPLGPPEARRRIEFCQGFLKQNPRCPDAAAVKAYSAALEPITRRDAPDDGLNERLSRLLSSPSIDNIYMVRYKSHQDDTKGLLHYYTSTPLPASGTLTSVEFRVASDGTTRRKTLGDKLIVGDRGLSPQSKLARQIKKSIESEEHLSTWNDSLIEWAKLVADDPQTDPICKLFLLRAMLTISADGSASLKAALSPTLKALERADDFRSVPWLDPEAPATVEKRREEARQLIAALPSWSKVVEAANGADKKFRLASAATPRPVGWLDRGSPSWSVRFLDPDLSTLGKEDCELIVALPEGSGGAWKPVGRILSSSGGGVALDRPGDAAQGRLVFLRLQGEVGPMANEPKGGR